jgi:citrate lyase subunit beta/citryl-CoA lyase
MTPASSLPRTRRSVLYVPASHERAIAKARTLPCDAVILDLEDAVAPEAKELARSRAVEALNEGGFGPREVIVRVNGLDTDWGYLDLHALRNTAHHAILAPKVSSTADVLRYAERIDWDASLWVMIETAASMFRLDEIAGSVQARLGALVLGTNDLAKETGTKLLPDRGPMLGALWMVLAAARSHGLAALDGVYNDIDDPAGFLAQARQGADLGFDGKTLIHPDQIALCNQAFTPRADEVIAARRIVAAFEDPANRAKGAIRVDGRMVERLHLAVAIRTLALADISERHCQTNCTSE